ncbi:hypothetical protein BDV98DRAFT_514393, partial [Pterulicium gracile]
TIRSCPKWYSWERRDTIAVLLDQQLSGMGGMEVARALLFFSFTQDDVKYSCTLVHWFQPTHDGPDSLTGMWTFKPQYTGNRKALQVINLDCIARAVQLIPCYDNDTVSLNLDFSQTLDHYRKFYVNKYADHHSHEYFV